MNQFPRKPELVLDQNNKTWLTTCNLLFFCPLENCIRPTKLQAELLLIGLRQRLANIVGHPLNNIQLESQEINSQSVSHKILRNLYRPKFVMVLKHINEIAKVISSGIGALKRLRPFIHEDTATLLYIKLLSSPISITNLPCVGRSQQRVCRQITKIVKSWH